ncbi:hypothetical protein GN956_G11016 [Arapaima gigas]
MIRKPGLTRAVHQRKEASLKKATINLANSPEKSRQKSNLLLFAKPEQVLAMSLNMIRSSDCEKKIEGLNFIYDLAQLHPNVLVTRLHDICIAIDKEVRNLHSVVSRVALGTMGHLHTHLQKLMDKELNWTARALLLKAGDSKALIRQEANVALEKMVKNCSPIRVMKALLNNEVIK